MQGMNRDDEPSPKPEGEEEHPPKPRQVLLADVLAVQVGQESQAFSRARLASGRADKQLLPPAMSLTLKLTADLPARPVRPMRWT